MISLKQNKSLLLSILIASCVTPAVHAILPTAAIDVLDSPSSPEVTLLASQGNFARSLPMKAENNEPMKTAYPPEDDPFLCNDINTVPSSQITRDSNDPFVLLVPRGQCTFEAKTIAAQIKYGASAIIIYGTLSSRYDYNTTTSSIIFPMDQHDYECHNGRVDIPTSALINFSPDQPYDPNNDNLLSGSSTYNNLCMRQSDAFEKTCASKACLLTGNMTNDNQFAEACCAWDFFIFLYQDGSMIDQSTGAPLYQINIPSLYITIEEMSRLRDIIQDRATGSSSGGGVSLILYTRWYPKYNISTVLIWALGVFVAAIASYLSASEYRYVKNSILNNRYMDERNNNENQGCATTITNERSNNSSSRSISPVSTTNGNPMTTRNGYERVANESRSGSSAMMQPPEDTVELTPLHAVFFMVFATCGLLTLFIFKIYNIVKIFYAFGCSGAIMQIIIMPLYYYIANKLNIRDRTLFVTEVAELGVVTYIQLLSVITSYGVGGFWLYMAFTFRHPDAIPFFWIMQDIMGACMCILFLQTMKLNSIKVASILLTAAFFYDIFFVFITPYFTKGGKSIMVDVATSGGPPKADPSWCEKYPDVTECQGGDPLPMLFTIPRISDYAGGSSLLGLGDIVLPGLLLSFAARYDEAKKLIAVSHSPRAIRPSVNSYYVPAVIAYGVGLAMANVAVYVMHMGQPALLYLVPCCLGTISFLGWQRGELLELWNTPKVLASCDKILYGVEENELIDSNEESGDHASFNASSTSDRLQLS